MAIVIGVKFKNSGKIYYFDPKGEEFKENDYVITETVRGKEYGRVVQSNKDVTSEEIVLPLKPIIRRATDKDKENNYKNLEDAANIVKESAKKVEEKNLLMKIVDAEYTFDRSKAIIYFTAESRIDFRELVKELAAIFRVRIELRQIYERDDIKMRGALASCGRPCCCTTYLKDFEKVSIKMAKNQGLSLNPNNISGCCGKLMCCLKYENELYQDVLRKMPKLGGIINTPNGEGVVCGINVLKEEVKVKHNTKDGGISIEVYPLEKIDKRS